MECNASGATADVFLHDGTSFNVILKDQNEDDNEWVNGSITEPPLDFTVPKGSNLTALNGIASVVINTQTNNGSFACKDDVWNMGQLEVSLVNPLFPNQPVCQINRADSAFLSDGTHGVAQFKGNASMPFNAVPNAVCN